MECKKAIIMVGGFGTRWLPITKAIEKCMLPVGNRPIVDYVVEDCIKAGIKDIIFVVGEEFEQIRSYYGRHQLLEEYLKKRGKNEQLQEIIDLSEKANFHYVIQDQHQAYGTAVPVWLCRHMIQKDEKILVVSGDQFIYNTDGSSEMRHLLDNAQVAGTGSAMLAVEVPHEEVYKYGIVQCHRDGERELYEDIIEKPSVEDAPSNLTNATYWLFDPKIFTYINDLIEQPTDGEYYLTDAANAYVADGNDLAVIRAKGEYLDCGTIDSWLRTNNRLFGKADDQPRTTV